MVSLSDLVEDFVALDPGRVSVRRDYVNQRSLITFKTLGTTKKYTVKRRNIGEERRTASLIQEAGAASPSKGNIVNIFMRAQSVPLGKENLNYRYTISCYL